MTQALWVLCLLLLAAGYIADPSGPVLAAGLAALALPVSVAAQKQNPTPRIPETKFPSRAPKLVRPISLPPAVELAMVLFPVLRLSAAAALLTVLLR